MCGLTLTHSRNNSMTLSESEARTRAKNPRKPKTPRSGSAWGVYAYATFLALVALVMATISILRAIE